MDGIGQVHAQNVLAQALENGKDSHKIGATVNVVGHPMDAKKNQVKGSSFKIQHLLYHLSSKV